MGSDHQNDKINEARAEQAEMALRRLAAIVEFSDDAIIGKDLNSLINSWNKGAEKIFGYAASEMVGTSIMRLIPADRQDEEEHILGKIKRGESVDHFETLRQTKDGRLVAVSVCASPIKDATGQIVGVSKIARDITERKRAEAALHQSQNHLRIVTENARVGLVVVNCERRYTFANGAYAEILGLPPANIVGQRIADVLAPLYEEQIRPRLDRAFAGERVAYELRKPATDGDYFYAVKYEPAIVDGLVSLVVVVITDVTERKRAENSLREREEQLRLYVEHSPAAIAMFDRDMKYLVVSRRWMESYRIVGQSIIGRSHYEVFPEISQRWKEIHRRCLGGAVEKSDEEPFARDDGTTDWIRWEVRPWHKADGLIGGIIIFSEDITARKKVEESLRLLGSAVEQSKESIVITDAELDLPGPKIIFVNPAFTQMTGYAAEEVIGKSPRILQGPRTDKAVLSRLRKNLEQGEAFAGEAVNYRKDGKEFDLEWQIAPLHDASGKITHFVATQRDVTARKKLEAQFRQSQKMEGIGQLAGGVAHDFNNILAAIEMQSGLLKNSGSLSAKQSEFADEISITVQRAAALTRQLLLFSRREVFQPRDMDLSESITSTAKMLRRILGENVQMQLKLASQPMFLHADAGMMDQVLMNLAVNARDAMPNGGQLIIETSGVEFDEFAASQSAQVRVGSFVRLSVSDSGCGIPPENLAKIFEPFFTTKDVGKGTGLGLATVFGIVQQHQGWINVYSEVNHGTTFRVHLPRLAKNGRSKSLPATPAATRGGNETILLAEDDPSLRVSVRKALSQLGYRILEAPTGVKALEVWKENRDEIHLLLTDLVMPDGMTGKDLAHHILQENPRLKVIYMSGYSAEVAGKDFPLKEGVNFLTKPFQATRLAQTIRELLDGKI